MIDTIARLLACPRCRAPYAPSAGASPTIDCAACGHVVPVVDGIPRFVQTPDTEDARRTQASFGHEWTDFNDWAPSGSVNFNDYFTPTRLLFALLRFLCWVLSVLLFALVVVPSKAARAVGVRGLESWPLYVYAKYPFTVLDNNQFDRFAAPIEKRYSPESVRDLLTRVGLTDVSVRHCFGWVGDGTRPA